MTFAPFSWTIAVARARRPANRLPHFRSLYSSFIFIYINPIAATGPSQTQGNKSEGLANKRKFKKTLRHNQTIQKDRTFQNNNKKFHQLVGGECRKSNQQTDAKEANLFWNKIWDRRNHNRKLEWIINMEKDLQGLEKWVTKTGKRI